MKFSNVCSFISKVKTKSISHFGMLLNFLMSGFNDTR
jgi:hypothetical protein